MSGYEVEMRQDVYGDKGHDFIVTLAKTITLPFVPVAGMGIGLEEDSDFGDEEYHVERVMWHHARQAFFVELPPCREVADPKHIARWLLERGWRLHVSVVFDAAADAERCGPESHVVRVGNAYYSLNDSELWTLREQGTQHTVVRPGRADPA